MRMSVAVMPRLLVTIVSAWRNQTVQDLAEVPAKARFVFKGTDGGGAADVEDIDNARLNSRFLDNSFDAAGYIFNVVMAGGGDINFCLKYHKHTMFKALNRGYFSERAAAKQVESVSGMPALGGQEFLCCRRLKKDVLLSNIRL